MPFIAIFYRKHHYLANFQINLFIHAVKDLIQFQKYFILFLTVILFYHASLYSYPFLYNTVYVIIRKCVYILSNF